MPKGNQPNKKSTTEGMAETAKKMKEGAKELAQKTAAMAKVVKPEAPAQGDGMLSLAQQLRKKKQAEAEEFEEGLDLIKKGVKQVFLGKEEKKGKEKGQDASPPRVADGLLGGAKALNQKKQKEAEDLEQKLSLFFPKAKKAEKQEISADIKVLTEKLELINHQLNTFIKLRDTILRQGAEQLRGNMPDRAQRLERLKAQQTDVNGQIKTWEGKVKEITSRLQEIAREEASEGRSLKPPAK